MHPDQVVEAIKRLGIIKLSRRTLLRWELDKLIPSSERGSHGRGIGAYSEYPEDTPAEYFASHNLLYGKNLTREEVVNARAAALSGSGTPLAMEWNRLKDQALKSADNIPTKARENAITPGTKETIAQRISLLIAENRVTQKELAEAIGTSRPAISQFAGGNSTPSIEVLTSIADYFQVSLDYLVGRNEDLSTTETSATITQFNAATVTAVAELQKQNEILTRKLKSIQKIVNP